MVPAGATTTSKSTTTTISTATRTSTATSMPTARPTAPEIGNTTRNTEGAPPIGTRRPRIGMAVRGAGRPRPTAQLAPRNTPPQPAGNRPGHRPRPLRPTLAENLPTPEPLRANPTPPP